MTKDDFYNSIIISDDDRARADRFIESKGLVKHVLIKKKLENWTSEKIKYTEISSTYRYDKRIRQVLFKYISYLEEFYRAVILDNYIDNTQQDFWDNNLNRLLGVCGNDLNRALEQLDFKTLLKQVRVLPESIRSKCGLPPKHIARNTFALKELRNAVMHNQFLLLSRNFAKCYVVGVDADMSANLKANILNLINFLPSGPKEQCVIDINNCKVDRNTDSDTKWELPPQIAINIS